MNKTNKNSREKRSEQLKEYIADKSFEIKKTDSVN